MATWDEYYKKNLAATEEQMKKQIADSDAIYNKQNETVKSIYEGQIGDEEQAYDDLSRQNEVQKYINAREVAENNANLGLTDSGLNRTQQTAVQLSASNQEAKIQRARQSAVEALTREMNSKLADIETSRISSEASIRSGYEQLASDAATSAYKADVEAETERVRAQQDSLKSANSDFRDIISGFADTTDNNIKLAEIYSWVNKYMNDTPFDDEQNYANSTIRAMLNAAGVSLADWRAYFMEMENIDETPLWLAGGTGMQSDKMAANRAHAREAYSNRQKAEDGEPLSSSRIAGQGFKY